LNIKKGLLALIIVGSLLLGDLGNFDATGGFSAADSIPSDMQSLNTSASDQAPFNSSDVFGDAAGDTVSDNSGGESNDGPR
jgi:hypothetical protein